MKEMLNEASELLKVGHAVAEEDPLFTKMMISQAIGLIDQALFGQAIEQEFAEQLMKGIRNMGRPL